MKEAIANRPWIWIVVGFAILLAALGAMVFIAEKNEPASVPLEGSTYAAPN